jgi:cell pole-organizing protein PopZ
MTEQATVSDDPSMEEILESIKRIIAEDDEGSTVNENISTSTSNDSDDSSDVLELTEVIEEGDSISEVQSSDEDSGISSIDDILADVSVSPPPTVEMTENSAEDIIAELDSPVITDNNLEFIDKSEKPQEEDSPKHVMNDEPEDALIEPPAQEAAGESIEKLLAAAKPAVVNAISDKSMEINFRSGSTLEDLVKESLRPMLKEWLNSNLPGIVEEIVEREIRRIIPH